MIIQEGVLVILEINPEVSRECLSSSYYDKNIMSWVAITTFISHSLGGWEVLWKIKAPASLVSGKSWLLGSQRVIFLLCLTWQKGP